MYPTCVSSKLCEFISSEAFLYNRSQCTFKDNWILLKNLLKMNNPILILQIVRAYLIHGKKGRVYQYTEHVVNVHPCVVKLSKFTNVLQSHRQEWTDQPFRPRWECLQVPAPRLVHQSIHINVFMSFHNHQEWGHKLFLACNWPWRAGFSSLTLCSSPLKNHWSVLPSKYSSLERCASVAQLQFPLSERWKIISRNQNVLNWFWLTWLKR